MGIFLDSLPKDKPLYALTIGDFELLMADLLPSEQQTPTVIEAQNVAPDKMSTSDLMKYLGVNRVTIHNMKKNGKIRYYGSRKMTFFKRSEIDEDLSSVSKKKKGNKA